MFNSNENDFLTYNLDVATVLFMKGQDLASVEIDPISFKSFFRFAKRDLCSQLFRQLNYGNGNDDIHGNLSEFVRTKKMLLEMAQAEKASYEASN
jgi:hypothetical protein